jgi:predicted DNA-binding protein (MmcQ/YjbR family)
MSSLNEQEVEHYLLAKQVASLYYPFGDDIKVFKVKNKIFATIAYGSSAKSANADDKAKHYFWMNIKCEPSEAEMLRYILRAIIAGYHMNKKNWDSVILNGSIPQGELERMIDNSYILVVSKMTKKDQASIYLYL